MTTTAEQAALQWIDAQAPRLNDRLTTWAAINTGTHNLEGIARFRRAVADALEPLDADVQRRSLPAHETIDETGQRCDQPLGDALLATKRPDAPVQVMLAIHLDTVFDAAHPFQTTSWLDADTLRGPGVADAKGGLLVLLTALEALERSESADAMGWRVVLNTDEEIGSPGSAGLLRDVARQCHFGLVFEPSLPDGALIGARQGSGNYTLVVRGQPAHVGRAFAQGRNAIHMLSRLVTRLATLNGSVPGVTVNVGRIVGGGAPNVVADMAMCRVNVRVQTAAQGQVFEHKLRAMLADIDHCDGYSTTWQGGLSAPPKPLDEPTSTLLQQIVSCGRQIGLELSWRESGGVCDGNRLAAAGLPTIDTLGACGGQIHSDQEYVRVSSLTQRAKLTALLLMHSAQTARRPAAPGQA